MRFIFHEIAELPPHAWCAEIIRGRATIDVSHGSGVETGGDWFVEGAWDGPFGADDFATATTFAGTGGRIRPDASAEFAAPTNPYRGLATQTTRRGLTISNSLAFLLAQTGSRPDIEYLDYYQDLFLVFNVGFEERPRTLTLDRGRRCRLQFHCNIVVGQQVTAFQKPAADAPAGYEDYRDRLVAMLQRLRENAADGRRRRTFRPLATLSRGYDSVACAALGARAGWRDAVTLIDASHTHGRGTDDDGSPVAEHLGLHIAKFEAHAWRQRTDLPEVGFVAMANRGVMVRLAGMEEKLRGSLLLLGNLGDRTWQANSGGVLPNWGRPRKPEQTSMGAESLWEYQLRAGFIAVYPAEFAAVHWDAMRRMLAADDMRPWSIGGSYDRPLPRRIAEEMRVPRELFGKKKMAGGHDFPMRTPSKRGASDYLQFLAEIGRNQQRFTSAGSPVTYRFHWGMNRAMRVYDCGKPGAGLGRSADVTADPESG